jgi:hypothetical protein
MSNLGPDSAASQVAAAHQVLISAQSFQLHAHDDFKNWVDLDFFHWLQVFLVRQTEAASERFSSSPVHSAKIGAHMTQGSICTRRRELLSQSMFVGAFQHGPFLGSLLFWSSCVCLIRFIIRIIQAFLLDELHPLAKHSIFSFPDCAVSEEGLASRWPS